MFFYIFVHEANLGKTCDGQEESSSPAELCIQTRLTPAFLSLGDWTGWVGCVQLSPKHYLSLRCYYYLKLKSKA